MAWVAILMGSESDWPGMKGTTGVLNDLGIEFEVRVTSAHRTPEETKQYIQDSEARNCGVFICAAGMAAHLAGAVAAHTVRPVIGVPIDSGPLQGFDAYCQLCKCLAGSRLPRSPSEKQARRMRRTSPDKFCPWVTNL